MSSSSSSPSKICSNVSCKETKSEQWRKGWRLRSGELAELCDRCGSAFEEVKFCEIFHADVAGWRNCESCGKRLHCGCIASVHTYLLLDVGGVECLPCAKKNFYMASNPMWSSSLFLPVNVPERLKDSSVKNWNQITGPTIAPRQRRQPANIWNTSTGQSELHSRLPYEVDRPNGVDNVVPSEHPPDSLEKKIEHPSEMVTAALERLANDTKKGLAAESSLTSSVSGLIFEKHPSSCGNNSFQSSAPKDSSSTSLFGMSVPFSSSSETHDPVRVSGALTQCQTPPAPLAKQFCHSPNNGIDSSGELHSQVQVRNGRLRAEARVRNQLLPRYWPRITDQELQQISGDSNSVVTPLFEKMLSASDAGRIGRLVLPKKCAEAYFPTISQPEGLPLKVQDARGKEWVFQFRFWPNNNSRMYVLEGVTPCIQSMQLQAGDTVTFSRMEPEGKLVMGFRKASSVPFEQDTLKTGNGISTSGDVNSRNGKSGEVPATCALRPSEVGGEANSNSTMNQLNPTDSANSRAKLDKPRSAPKDGARSKSSSLLNKKQSNKIGSKSKRLKIDTEDSMVLRLTWEEAQDLLRPPPKIAPNIVVIEGHEFEEYEEAPVLGRPTFFTTNASGENYQWAQCDQCFKWRKLPADALMPAEWHCYLNCSWDSERATCDAPQELTTEQLEALITSNIAASKRKKAKVENDSAEASEGLETLANVAILGEGGSLSPSAQATTKHPRHRPGCTCIVCIQPPSGKGPKHKQTCICNVCLTVRRRFRTLMLRREKRQSEKESGSSHKKQHIKLHAILEPEEEPGNHSGIHNETMDKKTLIMEGFSDDFRKESTPSPFKGRIDLNIQPEREDELSQASDPSSTMRLPRDETGVYFRDQRLMDPDRNRDIVTQIEPGCSIKEEKPDKACSPLDAVSDQTVVVSLSVSSSPATC